MDLSDGFCWFWSFWMWVFLDGRLPVETSCLLAMFPLHNAIASARLQSLLSVDSQSWCLVPQGISLLAFLIACFEEFIGQDFGINLGFLMSSNEWLIALEEKLYLNCESSGYCWNKEHCYHSPVDIWGLSFNLWSNSHWSTYWYERWAWLKLGWRWRVWLGGNVSDWGELEVIIVANIEVKKQRGLLICEGIGGDDDNHEEG